MKELSVLVAELKIIPYDRFLYPFNSIALSMISKGFSIAESCLILMDHTHTDEAFGLSRSLVECALILRYLTQDEETKVKESSAFVEWDTAFKNYWLHHARKSISDERYGSEVEDLARVWKLDGDPRPAGKKLAQRFVQDLRYATHRSSS